MKRGGPAASDIGSSCSLTPACLCLGKSFIVFACKSAMRRSLASILSAILLSQASVLAWASCIAVTAVATLVIWSARLVTVLWIVSNLAGMLWSIVIMLSMLADIVAKSTSKPIDR